MASHSDPPIRFPFRQGPSEIYGALLRPVAKVCLRTARLTWLPHYMFVDSGADYTLLPKTLGEVLGLRKEINDTLHRSKGVGGSIGVVMRRLQMKIGRHRFAVDVGWASTDDVPLLLGRADVFDRFDVRFSQREHVTEFHWLGPEQA